MRRKRRNHVNTRLSIRTTTGIIFILVVFVHGSANLPSILPISSSMQRHESSNTSIPIQITSSHHILSRRGGTRRNNKSSAITEGIKNFIASGIAASFSKTALAPFDTIKTIQQQQRSFGGDSLKFAEAAKVIMRRGKGFFELYAGLGAAVLGSIPSVGLYFGIYSYSKRVIGGYVEEWEGEGWRIVTIAASAAIGNTIASFSRVPYEVIKQKVQTGQYPSTLAALQSLSSSPHPILSTLFPLGGISSQMIRDIPYAIITLLSYEYLRDRYVSNHPPNIWRDLTVGAVAGGIGSYLTNPLDVIKTRLQTDKVYNGVWDCAMRTWGEEGPRAFLKGSTPRLIHKIPANGLFFVGYEFMRRVLRVEEKKKGEQWKEVVSEETSEVD